MRVISSYVPHRGKFRKMLIGVEYDDKTNETLEGKKIQGATIVDVRTNYHSGNMEDEIAEYYLGFGDAEEVSESEWGSFQPENKESN